MRVSGWKLPIEHLSASSVGQLLSCPEAFRQRRILKVRETMGVDKLVGAVDHAAAARNFLQKIETEHDLPSLAMDAIYDDCWDYALAEDGEPDWNDEDPNKTKDLGKKMTLIYHEYAAPSVQPIAVESHFSEKLPGVPIPIIGYIDVETQNILVERKTTKTRLKVPKPNWLLQGRLYSMIYSKPVEWQLVTRQVTPQLVMPESEPGLRLEDCHPDATLLMVQQAAYMLEDFWFRYGPDNPWPLHGLAHPFQCSYCFAGPKYGASCIAWKGDLIDSPPY